MYETLILVWIPANAIGHGGVEKAEDRGMSAMKRWEGYGHGYFHADGMAQAADEPDCSRLPSHVCWSHIRVASLDRDFESVRYDGVKMICVESGNDGRVLTIGALVDLHVRCQRRPERIC